MTRFEFVKKNKRYICSVFYSCDDNHEEKPFYILMDKNEWNNNWPNDKNTIKANTFKELMLNAVIKGIDLDDINFNKLSYMEEINVFLREHKIDHFETKNIDEAAEFITYS